MGWLKFGLSCCPLPTPVAFAMASKEIVHAFRWHRAFAKLKTPVKEVEPLSRYTNFTLNHVWEKFDCQTTLLTKEVMLPLAKRNPQLFDPELDVMHTVRLSLMQPQSSPGTE